MRRAAGPWSPRNEPAGELHQRAAADDVAHAVGGALDRRRRARGGPGSTPEAADLQVAQDLGQPQRPARGRASPAAATARRRRCWPSSSSWSLMRARWSRAISAPVWIVERDVRPRRAPSRSVAHPGAHAGAARWGSAAIMWGVHTIVRVPASHAARAISTESPIVAGPSSMAGQQVAVEVDHGSSRVAPASAGTTPGADGPASARYSCSPTRGISSVGRAPGSHPGGQRFESAILHSVEKPRIAGLFAFSDRIISAAEAPPREGARAHVPLEPGVHRLRGAPRRAHPLERRGGLDDLRIDDGLGGAPGP